MRVVVTGAGGLTGSRIVARLATQTDVVAVVRFHRPPILDRVSVVEADCTDVTAMTTLLMNGDVLVHGAGIRLAPALSRVPLSRLARIVAISSAGVYSQHRASAESYKAGEDALLAAHPDVLLVRPTMVYGSERDRNIHHVLRFADRFRFLPLIAGGIARIQPIHYEDLAEAIVKLTTKNVQGVIDAGGGAPVSLVDAEREMLLALGLSPTLIPLPSAPLTLAGQVIDRIRGSRLAERVERLHEDRTVDIAQLVSLTGLRPRGFADGVRDEVARLRALRIITRRD
jgi:nucleoside-diphosphate-sugar epimerase